MSVADVLLRWRAQTAAWAPPSAFVALAAIVAFLGIDRKSIWLDEALSILDARMPFAQMVERGITVWGANMLGYEILLQRWIRLVGEEPWAVRSLSAIFATVAAVLVYALCRRAASRPWALVGAVAFVAHAMYMAYAQETRAYALLVLVVAASALALLRMLEQPSRARLIVYVLCGAAMAWVQVLSAVVIASQALYALAWHRSRWRWWLPAYVLIGIAWLPVLWAAISLDDNLLDWIPPLSRDFPRQLAILAGGQGLAGQILVTIWGFVAAGALVLALRKRDPLLGFGVMALVIPVLLVVAISLFQPAYIARYMIGVLPAMALVVARLGERLGRVWVVPALLIVALLAFGSVRSLSVATRPPWDAAIAWLLARSNPADTVVFHPAFDDAPFDYYVPLLHAEARAPTKRPDTAVGGRLWLVISSRPTVLVPAFDALVARIEERYGPSEAKARFGGIEILRFERP